MASGKSYFARASYRFISSDYVPNLAPDSAFELDESDLYNSDSPEFLKSSPRFNKRSSSKSADRVVGCHPLSLPVNIPDWSKILKEEYTENRRLDSDDDEDEDVDEMGGVRVPPHELLAMQMARSRIASFSVHEGVGRTLKGRDLSRLRNAIWEKTGFQD